MNTEELKRRAKQLGQMAPISGANLLAVVEIVISLHYDSDRGTGIEIKEIFRGEFSRPQFWFHLLCQYDMLWTSISSDGKMLSISVAK